MTLPTEAGQTKPRPSDDTVLIDAINQVFGLLRINYHNQYYKAFPDAETLNPVKKLWFEELSKFGAPCIGEAVKSVIGSSDYLPTLYTMIQHCERISGSGFPDPHSAYTEACQAPSPKAAFDWSHPAIFHAGQRTGWYFLSRAAESAAYPVFKQHYKNIVDAVRGGMAISAPKAITTTTTQSGEKLEKAAALSKLKALRSHLFMDEK